jgi:integrase
MAQKKSTSHNNRTDIGFHDHNLEKWGAHVTVAKYLENGTITEADKDLIERYIAHRRAVKKKLSKYRIWTLTVNLVYWRQYIRVPYTGATIENIETALGEFKDADYKQNTEHTRISILKGFLMWMIDEGLSTIPIKKIKEIETPAVDTHTTEPNELLQPEDVYKLLDTTTKPMHRAFMAVLWESGARPQEIASLLWSDIVPDQYGMKLYINDTKTSKKRYSRLTMAAPYLDEWKKTAIYAKETDLIFAFWPKKNKRNPDPKARPLSYGAARQILYRAQENAGLEKKIWMYNFRKSRITNMIKENYREAAIRETIWNNQGTSMMKTYLTLNEKDIDKMMLESQGIKLDDENKDENPLKRKTCDNCHTKNKATAKFCDICGFPLMDELKKELKEADEQAEILPEYQARLKEQDERIKKLEAMITAMVNKK